MAKAPAPAAPAAAGLVVMLAMIAVAAAQNSGMANMAGDNGAMAMAAATAAAAAAPEPMPPPTLRPATPMAAEGMAAAVVMDDTPMEGAVAMVMATAPSMAKPAADMAPKMPAMTAMPAPPPQEEAGMAMGAGASAAEPKAAAAAAAAAAALPLPGALTAMPADESTMGAMGATTADPTMRAPPKTNATARTTTNKRAKRPAVSCPDLPPVPRGTRRFALSAAPARGPLAATQSLAYNNTGVGPLIRVRRGDTVQVDVTNDGVAAGTSVHWHGLDLPGAAWADGVQGVSQRPIPDGATFSYRFVAEPAGTFWYHSHTGGQFADGLRGPLIVDEDDDDGGSSDPHASLYDEDLDAHVLMLADVFQSTAEEQLAELQAGGMGGAAEAAGVGAAESMMGMPAKPEAPSGKMAALCDPEVLNQDISDAPWYGVQVNGQGVIAGAGGGAAGAAAAADAAVGRMLLMAGGGNATATMATTNTTTKTTKTTTGAPHVITVERGKRYRLRLIAGVSSWALKLNFTGGHAFDVIALDGRPIEPKRARALILTPGERADVVLKADRPVANYWVDVSTLDGRNSPFILHYRGAPDPLGPRGEAFLRTMRLALPEGCRSALGGQPGLLDLKNATGLVAAAGAGVAAPPAGPADKAFTIYLADASSSVPPPSFLEHIKQGGNNISNIHGFTLHDGNVPAKGPACPPVPAAGGGGGGGNAPSPSSKYCWSLNWNVYEPPAAGVPLILGSPDPSRPRPRTYVIDVDQGDVVDLVLVNPSLMVHPMHLHGQGFHVLGTGNGLVVDGEDRLLPSKARLNLRNPPVRDTVPVAQAAPATPAGDGETELDPSSYGYAVVRFKADNPGPWAFHCHIELHAGSGMFLAFSVRPKGGRASKNAKALAAADASSSSSPPWFVPGNLDCDADYVRVEDAEMEPSTAPAAPSASSSSSSSASSSAARRVGAAAAALAAAAAMLGL